MPDPTCLCGAPLSQARTGRTREFCCDDCRWYAFYLSKLEEMTARMAERSTFAGWLQIRGRLFALSAQRAWNRGKRREA